jgi:acyl-CoA reductase-like NAD-dependent aldehyde dehydrogenase
MNQEQIYIDGAWTPAGGTGTTPVTDRWTEQPFASYRTASAADVDRAVRAAPSAPGRRHRWLHESPSCAGLVEQALNEGAARLNPEVALPPHGFFVAPTVLGHVNPDSAIAQEEVFGPVLVLLSSDGVEEGVALATGTPYGLAASVWGPTPQAALAVARRLRAGQVDVNGAPFNPAAPFGGFKHCGLGWENGRHGIEEFLEPVAIQMPPAYFDTPTMNQE